MNLDWQWQQENVALRKENAELKRKLAVYLVGKVAKEKAESGKIFSKKQMKFIKENDLDYFKVYRLAHRYNSVEEALVEVLEGTI